MSARLKVPALFQSFHDEYFHISKQPFYNEEDLNSAADRYIGFVCGSDMIWSDIGQNLDAYFLRFANEPKRISYAPSMTGTDNYSESKNALMADRINGIRFLSCREQCGVDYVKRMTNRDAFLAVDPTLLLSKNEWIESLHLQENANRKKYILCYMFGGVPDKLNKKAHRIAKLYGYEIRYIPMNVNEFYSELKCGHSGAYGPKEFVDLFIHAAFVITNSFHGLLLSLISEVPFVLLHRSEHCAWGIHEERMDNILSLIGQQNRFLSLDQDITFELLTLVVYQNETLRGIIIQ